MIQEHLEQLRTRLEQADGLPEATRSELLNLVSTLRQEALGGSVAEETSGESSTSESEGQTGIGKLLSSVDELEASHPELAASINQVANVLGRMGI